jgi:hypothetical protein
VNQSLTLSAPAHHAHGHLPPEGAGHLGEPHPGGGPDRSERHGPTPASDFTISLNPTSLTVQQGASGTTQLTITPQGGFTGTVSLSLVAGQDQVPQGLTLSPESVQVTGGAP